MNKRDEHDQHLDQHEHPDHGRQGQHEGSADHLGDHIFGEERRTTRRARRRQPKGSRGRRLGCLTLALILVVGGGLAAVTGLRPLVERLPFFASSEPTDFPGPGSGSVTVSVARGDTGEQIATTLKSAGVVKTRTAYLEAARSDPQVAAKIQVGSYTMKRQMTGADAFAWLTDSANRVGKGVTLPEGLWKSEVFARLSKATGRPVKEYEAAARTPAAIGLPAAAKGNVEGYLFPATYEFDASMSATQQLKTMVSRTVSELDEAGVAPGERRHVVTVASIIEGEALFADDRGKVARVIENRIGDPTGPTVGLLQMDSTVNYALQKRGSLTRAEYESAKSNPYDTYAHKGLPPGPIGNPGTEAIKAAAAPTPGPWFYFATVNLETGETLFATTLAEQDRNVAKLRAWCNANETNRSMCEGTG